MRQIVMSWNEIRGYSQAPALQGALMPWTRVALFGFAVALCMSAAFAAGYVWGRLILRRRESKSTGLLTASLMTLRQMFGQGQHEFVEEGLLNTSKILFHTWREQVGRAEGAEMEWWRTKFPASHVQLLRASEEFGSEQGAAACVDDLDDDSGPPPAERPVA
jgi:hypothetical protein